jgi:hypothetical protein
MTLPNVAVTFKDGSLGGVATASSKRTAKIGVATGSPALLSAVTSAGTTPPVIAVSGVPVGTYNVRIECTLLGARGTWQFRYSLDGGASWAAVDVVSAATYVLGATGITLAIATGSAAVDNVWMFTAIPIPVDAYTDFAAMAAKYTSGPLCEAAADLLAEPNRDAQELLVAPIYPSVSGTVTVPVLVGTSPAVTTTGTPKDDYQIKVVVTTGGARGTAVFKYSLDGGDSYSALTTTAATVEMFDGANTSGVTLAMASGTYVAGDYWTATCEAPSYSTSDVNNTLDALKRDGRGFRFVHVVGSPSGASDAAKVTALQSLVAAVQTRLETMEGAAQYTRAILDGPDVSDSAIGSMSATTAKRCAYGHGRIELDSVLTAKRHRRPLAWAAATRLARIGVGVSCASLDANECGGSAALPARVRSISRDERVTGSIGGEGDLARAICSRTWNGLGGFYLSFPNTLAAIGSDYSKLQHGFLADLLATICYAEIVKLAQSKVRISKTTGYIDEAFAIAIESKVEAIARTALVSEGHCVDVSVKVSRTDNLLSGSTWNWTANLTPFGYPVSIAVSVGLKNPALSFS